MKRTRALLSSKFPTSFTAEKGALVVACGCFNPPTLMHLRLFEMARDELRTQLNSFVVGGIMSPTHDGYRFRKPALLDATHRVAMCESSVASSSWIAVSKWEVEQAEWTRTRAVLDYLKERVDADMGHGRTRVFLVCGADLVDSFMVPGLWKDEDVERMVSVHGLCVVTRAGHDLTAVIEQHPILRRHAENIVRVPQRIANDISSTAVRDACAAGRSIKYLVDDSVIPYIEKHALYREE